MPHLGTVRLGLGYLGLIGAVLGALGPSQQPVGALGPTQQTHHRHYELVAFNSSLGLHYPEPIVFPAQATHNASIICLHGLVRFS